MKTAKKAKKSPVQDERRQQTRRHLLWRARLQCGSHEFDCWVYDISYKGARVRFDLPLVEDCGIVLDIPDLGLLSARVAWSVAGQMGIEFIRDEAAIKKLLGKRVKILGL